MTNKEKFSTSLQPYINLIGVHINAINLAQAIEIIDCWICHRDKTYVCITPAHGIMECYYDPELRKIFNSSGMTTPDGMSVVWLLKLMGHKNVTRVYGPDLMREICQRSIQGGNYRHFFYGGAPGIPEKLSSNLHRKYPGLVVVGTYSPPYRLLTPDEDDFIVDLINNTNPDIVWVGISTPKQERWMSSHLGKINAPVMIGVGAAFDFLSGNKSQAPRWMQRSGLEWLFRFATEPRRLWRRYIKYPLFVLLVVAQVLGIYKPSPNE